MAFHKPKPETLARIGRELREQQKANFESLTRRIRAKAEQEGPDSIWADMLRERLQKV